MKLVSLQDLVDLTFALFPRASYRVGRRLAAIRSKLSHPTVGRTEATTEARRARVRFDRELLTLARFSTAPSERRRGRAVTIEGLEHLEAALARGHGAIVWEVSFGSALLGKVALLERGFSIVQAHGPEHGGSPTWVGQHVIRRMHRRISARLFEEIIELDHRSLGYLRRIVDRLRSNKIVCIRALGRMGNKFVATRFRGEPAYFPTGALTLAKQTGAALIPMFCFRDNGQERLVLSPPLPVRSVDKGDGGLAQLTALYLAELAHHVDAHPEQWWGWPKPPAGRDRLTILQGDGAELRSP